MTIHPSANCRCKTLPILGIVVPISTGGKNQLFAVTKTLFPGGKLRPCGFSIPHTDDKIPRRATLTRAMILSLSSTSRQLGPRPARGRISVQRSDLPGSGPTPVTGICIGRPPIVYCIHGRVTGEATPESGPSRSYGGMPPASREPAGDTDA